MICSEGAAGFRGQSSSFWRVVVRGQSEFWCCWLLGDDNGDGHDGHRQQGSGDDEGLSAPPRLPWWGADVRWLPVGGPGLCDRRPWVLLGRGQVQVGRLLRLFVARRGRFLVVGVLLGWLPFFSPLLATIRTPEGCHSSCP